MLNAISIVFLLVSMAACTAGFMYGIDKEQAYKERSELVRCQEGYAAACRKWQQIELARATDPAAAPAASASKF